MTGDRHHGVLVNECRVFAVASGARWWVAFLLRAGDRVEELQVTLGGAVCWVPCDSADDARWLADHMASQGIPEHAVQARARRGPDG